LSGQGYDPRVSSRRPFLHVVTGTKPPDTPQERVRKRVRKHAKPAAILACPRCTGHEVIETKIGVYLKNGKPRGGTKVLLCAGCLLKGERVVVA
jgi:hypothetical protein